MRKSASGQATLPLEVKPFALASGDVMDIKTDCTLPLAQDITLRRINGAYGELDRKLWLALVHLAFDDLEKSTFHEASLRELSSIMHECGGADEQVGRLFKSAERLSEMKIRWDDADERGFSVLLSSLVLKKYSGRIFYQFPEALKQKLLDNRLFNRLKLHFALGLSGKYAVSLYVLLEGIANLRNPTITVSLDDLRDRLNVPEGKLADWRNFNQFALRPAIDRINEGKESTGFTADYQTESEGRKIVAVTFTVTKTKVRKETEQKLARNVNKSVITASNIRPFSGVEYEKLKKHFRGTDIYPLEDEWRDSCTKKGLIPKNPVGHFTQFVKKKKEQVFEEENERQKKAGARWR